MVLMALLVAVITVCVGMLASRVAAGAGRDLRGSVYKKSHGLFKCGNGPFLNGIPDYEEQP